MAIKNVGEYTQAENLDGLKFPAFDEGEGEMFKVPSELFMNPYDQVIRTQAEFDTMIESPTWLDAQSVALVGEFTATASIVIPATVKQIHGFNGAKITVTASGGTVYGLSYAVRPDLDKGYEIRNLEVVCTGEGASYSYGFSNCSNLTNCTGTGTAGFGYGYGFSNCTNLTNCTGTGTGGSDGSGYGFSNCTNLTNCTGTGTGIYGYGFSNCSYCNGCKSGITPSTTSIWGGTNTKIDADSCEME